MTRSYLSIAERTAPLVVKTVIRFSTDVYLRSYLRGQTS
jgi:hypothetical protein